MTLRQRGLHFGDCFIDKTPREVRLATLCDEAIDAASGDLIMPADELRVRLGDWLGNLIWQAECKRTIAAATHPRLAALVPCLQEFCGSALRIIEIIDPPNAPRDRADPRPDPVEELLASRRYQLPADVPRLAITAADFDPCATRNLKFAASSLSSTFSPPQSSPPNPSPQRRRDNLPEALYAWL